MKSKIYSSKIGLITTSSSISPDLYVNVKKGIKKLNEYGFKTLKSKNFYDNYFWSAGTGKIRAQNLEALYTQDLALIICSQGWETANEILNFLDFSKIWNIPLMGFSDNTILVNAISYKKGILNYLWPDLIRKFWWNFTSFDEAEFKEIFIKKRNFTTLSNGKLLKSWKNFKGYLRGGNIRSFLKLFGTEFFPNLEKAILLIEEVNKNSLWWESIINELVQKKIIEKVNWIILGYNHKYFSTFWESIEELFVRKLKDYSIFIYSTDSFWHKSKHSLFPIWKEVFLDHISHKLLYTHS